MLSKRLSPAIFGLALLCFFLPWLNVSCQGQKVLSVSGYELATQSNFKPAAKPLFGQPTTKQPQKPARSNPVRVFAIIALIVTICGIAAGFLKGIPSSISSIILGILGIIFLVLMRIKITGETSKIEAFIQVGYGAGYYLSFLLYIVAIIYNFVTMKGGAKIPTASVPLYSTQQGTATPSRFCTECGTKNEQDNAFCSNCGAKLT